MSKSEADSLEQISISFLKKLCFLNGGVRTGTLNWTYKGSDYKSSVGIEASVFNASSFESYIRIHYTQTDRNTNEKKDFDYRIPLTTTPCRYGGNRYWFICPWSKNGAYCGRRVGKLYKDGDYFACRHCYELTYASRNTNRKYKFFPFFNAITIEDKIEELRKKIKRPYYNGRPTKRQQQLEKLFAQADISYRRYAQLERHKMV